MPLSADEGLHWTAVDFDDSGWRTNVAHLDLAPSTASPGTRAGRTLRVPGEGFKRVMSERPEMSEAIVAELVRRMRGMMQSGPTPQTSSPSIQLPKPEN